MPDKNSILIVDDEKNLRRSLSLILKHHGYTVVTAANIEEARGCLETASYDLVFLDVKLPDGSGLNLLPEMHNRYPDMPVLILTAHDKLGVAIEAVTHGALDYLLKPVDPARLLERVREVLGEGRIERGEAGPIYNPEDITH
jgi:DNA-binding NtrC family response regulator